MLTIVDIGVGNLRNVYMAFRRLGVEAEVTADAGAIRRARAIVLPGVGAFGDAVASIRALSLEATLVDAARDGVPFMGICVGLQLLFEMSEEMGEHRGLGILEGRVRRFPPGLPVPHMGWNQIRQVRPVPLWRGIPNQRHAYFVHSYYVDPRDPSVVAGTTDYGGEFVSAVARGNLYGIQFHPEKSQDVGRAILRNFLVEAGLMDGRA